MDWLSYGKDEALKSGEDRLLLSLSLLNSNSIVRFISSNPKFTKMLIGGFSISWFLISGITDLVDNFLLNKWLEDSYLLTRLYTFILITLIYSLVIYMFYLHFKKKIR